MTPIEKEEELFDLIARKIGSKVSGTTIIEEWEAAKACHMVAIEQILNLSGMPQYQIIFWRKVKEIALKRGDYKSRNFKP